VTAPKLPEKTWVQIALGITAGTIASLGITAVTSAGFALSFDAIRTVARASHINIHLDWMLPVAIDGAMAVASVTAIVMQRMGKRPVYPWVVVLANVLISVGCNALHAYQGGGEKPLPGGWAMAVSAIPAVNLALALHLAIELVMAVVKRSEKADGTRTAENRFAGFAPTVIHGGTQPQPQPATQTDRTLAPAVFAPPSSAPAHNGSLNGSHPPSPAGEARVSRWEKAGGQPAAKAVERPAAKPAANAKKPTHPLTDDPNPSIRALARAYAKNPAKTNPELAKLAKVSPGTANRYLPAIRAAAVDAANADADEERALGPLSDKPAPFAMSVPSDPDSEAAERVIPAPLALPVSEPAAATTGPVNGHHPSLTEESR